MSEKQHFFEVPSTPDPEERHLKSSPKRILITSRDEWEKARREAEREAIEEGLEKTKTTLPPVKEAIEIQEKKLREKIEAYGDVSNFNQILEQYRKVLDLYKKEGAVIRAPEGQVLMIGTSELEDLETDIALKTLERISVLTGKNTTVDSVEELKNRLRDRWDEGTGFSVGSGEAVREKLAVLLVQRNLEVLKSKEEGSKEASPNLRFLNTNIEKLSNIIGLDEDVNPEILKKLSLDSLRRAPAPGIIKKAVGAAMDIVKKAGSGFKETVDILDKKVAEERERDASQKLNIKNRKEASVKKKGEVSKTKEEKLKGIDLARAVFAKAEAEYNRYLMLRGRFAWGKDAVEKKKEYELARREYEKSRAEHIGNNALRFLEEKVKLAEAEAESKTTGSFEKIKSAWRFLGDMNLERFLTPEQLKNQSKLARMVRRSLSLRAGISLALLGTGVGFGVGGSMIGLSAFAARRFMSGGGVAFGLYDLMQNFEITKVKTFDEKKILDMNTEEIEHAMTRFEGWAKVNGDRILKDKTYNALKAELLRRIEANPRAFDLRKMIEESDREIREAAKKVLKTKLRQGVLAVGAGFLVGSGGLAKAWSGIKELLEGVPAANLTAEDVREAYSAPLIDGAMAEEAIINESHLPVPVLEAASHPSHAFPLFETNFPPVNPNAQFIESLETPQGNIDDLRSVNRFYSFDKTGEVSNFSTPDVLEAETFESVSIKRGGSVWSATREFVGEGNGKISEAQFDQAIRNSYYTLANGERIPFRDLHLVHPGTVISYDPSENIFKITNVVGELGVGREELLRAFISEHRPVPVWLQEYFGVDELGHHLAIDPPSVPEVPGDILNISPDLPETPTFFREDTSSLTPNLSPEVLLEAPSELTIRGAREVIRITFEYDGLGNIDDVIIRGHGNPRTAMQLFEGDYVQKLGRAMEQSEVLRGMTPHEAMSALEERALAIDLGRSVFTSIPQDTPHREAIRRLILQNIASNIEDAERVYGNVFKNVSDIVKIRN